MRLRLCRVIDNGCEGRGALLLMVKSDDGVVLSSLLTRAGRGGPECSN